MQPASTLPTTTLNASMTTLWQAHRRSRLNLNSAPASSSSSQPPAELPPAAPPTAPSTPPTRPATPPLLEPSAPSPRKRPASSSTAPSSKRRRPSPAPAEEKHPVPPQRLSQLGGLHAQIDTLLRTLGRPLRFPELYTALGTRPPRGVLLYGPPGCGKTMLARAVCGELGVRMVGVSSPSVVGGTSGESERAVREVFEDAKKVAPCIIFFDEIDAITPKRDTAQREMERRIVAQLLTCMDDLSLSPPSTPPILLLAATNRPDALDPSLRRPGRFDIELELPVPTPEAREEILRVLAGRMNLSEEVDLGVLARLTPGYVGADLEALLTGAGEVAADRVFEELGRQVGLASAAPPGEDVPMSDGDAPSTTALQLPPRTLPTPFSALFFSLPSPLPPTLLAHPSLHLTPSDLSLSLSRTTPSLHRTGFTPSPPPTSWSDIGALSLPRQELHMSIVQPIRRPQLFAHMGLRAPRGVLLWGPPGCGKTLLARAVASEGRAGFIGVKGPEMLNKYVGESERAVRAVFERAGKSAPCVVFFDELDALVPKRSDKLSEASTNIVNTLLTELDGLASRAGIFVIGATNRPDMIDPALLRPGRFDKLVYVDLPDAEERVEILRTVVRREGVPVALGEGGWGEVEGRMRGGEGEGMSGADISAVVADAATQALQEALAALEPVLPRAGSEAEAESEAGPSTAQIAHEQASLADLKVEARHFERAMRRVGRSVGEGTRRRYEGLRGRFGGRGVRGKGVGGEEGEGERQRAPDGEEGGEGGGEEGGVEAGEARIEETTAEVGEKDDVDGRGLEAERQEEDAVGMEA